MKTKQASLAAILLVTVVLSLSNLPGCGPFFPEAVFTETRHPPAPLADYARGRLGVLQPTYARKYLFVAYRYLSGKPLSPAEQKVFVPPPAMEAESKMNGIGALPMSTALKEWLDGRNKVPGTAELLQIDTNRSLEPSAWQQFPNCSDDAFRNARKTLEARIGTFGLSHPGIKSWVAAQDVVFSNCRGGSAIPAPAEDALPQVLRQDREYQIAAAHFYSMHYDESLKKFREIASESASPWSRIAPYLSARCLIRMATVPVEDGKFDANLLSQAERELKAILQDNGRRDLYSMASKLENFIAVRLHPLDQMRMLSGKLQDPASVSDFSQDLIDYQYLLDRATVPSPSVGIHQTSDLTDWILTVQVQGEEGLAYSLEKWKTTGSIPWLISTISKMGPGHQESANVVAAALKLPKDSPAFATAQYHRIRLLLESGKNGEARSALDEILPGMNVSLPKSSLNLFLAQRMRLARNLDEFLALAPRFPSGIEYLSPGEGKPDPYLLAWFDIDSARVFNEGLPLVLLRRAAVSKALPTHLQKQLIRVSWVRAILLSDETVAKELDVDLARNFPELKADLKSWATAGDAESRRFASAMLLLHFPGMSPFLQSGVPRRRPLVGIDDFRENWWCGYGVGGDLELPTGARRYRYSWDYAAGADKHVAATRRTEPSEFPAFLDQAERVAVRSEWNRLAAMETAPNYLGKVVLSWAAGNPKDARVPEALHLVVKATRFGCTDDATGRYSRDAFQLLHKKYEDTKWAKMTPFWYR